MATEGRARRLVVGAATTVCFATFVLPAHADPLRLRGDALVQTQQGGSPTGVLVLRIPPIVFAEIAAS